MTQESNESFESQAVNQEEIQERGLSKAFPSIYVDDKQLRKLEAETWKLVLKANVKPEIFRKDGRLFHLVPVNESVQLSMMDQINVLSFLTKKADWKKMDDGAEKPTVPPSNLQRLLLSRPHEKLPKIQAVISSPVFGKNGALINSEGYHAEDEVWFDVPKDLDVPHIPEKPSPEQIADAKTLLFDDLLGEFPFVSDSDRAHAISALLLPFVRRMIEGPTPLHLVEAPSAGSGKSLLCRLIGSIATGSQVEACSLPRSADELKRLVTSQLLNARPVILFDNVVEKVDNSSLASVLTAKVWTDRLLGKSMMITSRNLALWMMTGNNPRLSLEIARRAVRIRIDAKADQPWKRQQFRHKHIEQWARQNRGKLVGAALTLIQAWIAEGKPLNDERLGSYEDWSQVLGGILEVTGIPGFLENLNSFYEQADTDGQMWREFVAAWFDKFQDATVQAQDLTSLCQNQELMTEVRGAGTDQSQRTRLGKALRQVDDRLFGDFKIASEFRKNENANVYRLLREEKNVQN